MATRFSPNGNHTIQEAIELAVEAVERGDKQSGEETLSWVLQQDPKNAVAWLWLACCAPDDQSKQECYRRASQITAGL